MDNYINDSKIDVITILIINLKFEIFLIKITLCLYAVAKFLKLIIQIKIISIMLIKIA